GDRQLAGHLALAFRPGLQPPRGHRQRVRRGNQQRAHRRARRAGPHPLRDHFPPQRGRPGAGDRGPAGPEQGPGMRLNSSFTYRKVVDRGMAVVCAICFIAAFIPLISVLWLVISKGAAGLSWAFFTELPRPVGEEGGGIGNALVGTLYMVGLACVIGLPLGCGAGVYLAEKGDGTIGNTVRFMAEVLSGVPSIVIGIVAYALVVIPMGHFSAWAGAVALAILMIPTLARATEEL